MLYLKVINTLLEINISTMKQIVWEIFKNDIQILVSQIVFKSLIKTIFFFYVRVYI